MWHRGVAQTIDNIVLIRTHTLLGLIPIRVAYYLLQSTINSYLVIKLSYTLRRGDLL